MRLITTGYKELDEMLDGVFFSIGTQLIKLPKKRINFFSNWKMEHDLYEGTI